jgi:predicted DNA-binding transcriptional regulator AlpA
MTDNELLNLSAVRAFFGGVHTSTVYRWRDAGLIPAGEYIGPNTVRWRRGALEEARERMLANSDTYKQARAARMAESRKRKGRGSNV